MSKDTQYWIFAVLVSIVLAVLVYIGLSSIDPTKPDPEAEKLQLEIQHLKYQVGIDSLRYDMELKFYEKRKEKK